MTLFRLFLLSTTAVALTACTEMQTTTTERPTGEAQTAAAVDATPPTQEEIVEAAAITQAPPPRPRARATPAQLDTTTAEQKAAAAAPAEKAETKLGTTIASLGDVSEPGFWIKTPLVKTRSIGRVVNPANGKSSKVDLIPLDGPASGGSQLSLPTLQLLGIPLTDLPEVEVYQS